MVVYRRTNTQNGKVYIGKTTRTVAQRWTNLLAEVKRGSTNPIHNAIRKYGAGSFVTDILYEAKTFEELTAMETFFIERIREAKRQWWAAKREASGL